LRTKGAERRHRSHELRARIRLLHRSDREKTALPFPPRIERALVRHGRLQSRLQVLSELGYFESARAKEAARERRTGSDRTGGEERWREEHRVYVQRSRHLRRVCGRYCAGGARARRL